MVTQKTNYAGLFGQLNLQSPNQNVTAVNPAGLSAEDSQQVTGVGALLGLPIGSVTVAQAMGALDKLAKEASTSTAARAQLATIQNDLYVAGYYGTKKPKLGTLSGGDEDGKAFRAAAIDASNSGQKMGDFLTTAAQNSTSTGSVGSAPIPQISEKQQTFAPSDIEGTVNATAQRLLGRNASQGELQAVADQLNQQSAAATQADATASEASAAGSAEGTKGNADVDSFLAAIRQHESGGNYQAENAKGGASGAYQYIQSTWTSEAKAAGYGQYANAPAGQAPPAVQDAVARYNALNLYNQYGNWQNTAEAWYYPAWAGDASKQNSVPYPSAGNTETIGAYGQQIVNSMNQTSAQAGPPAVVNIAGGQVGKTPSVDPYTHNPANHGGLAGGSAITAALGQQGTNYVWGGESPGSGFDCSGLVQWSYQQAGISLPRVAQDQYNKTTKVDPKAAQAGDLVFFGTGPNGVDHVGIYIGNDQMIVAPHTGTKVQVQSGVLERKDLVGVTSVTSNRMTPADWAALSKAGATPGAQAYLTGAAAGATPAAGTGADNVTVTPTPAGASSVDDAATNVLENQDSGQFQQNNLLNVFDSINKTLGANAGASGVRNTPVSLAAQTS